MGGEGIGWGEVVVAKGSDPMIHFQSYSYNYMMCDQSLWEVTDCDVVIITIEVRIKEQSCSITIRE